MTLEGNTRAAILSVMVLAGCSDQPDPETLALGARIYGAHCASCHGVKLEGQPNWKEQLPNGKWPAPPHDDSGHTWQHSDRWLFHVVEKGLVPPLVKPGHQTDMQGYGDKLSNAEIRAVLAYIKSQWSEETNKKREEMLSKRRSPSEELLKLLPK